MNDRAKQRDALVSATLEVVRRHHERQSAISRIATPQVGDVYLFPEPAELDFRWVVAVVEDGEYFLVPADTHFLVGAADLVIADPTSSAPLVARCEFGCWVEASYLQHARLLTAVDPQVGPTLQNQMLRVRLGARGVDSDDGEVESDPVYQEWCVFVAQAVESLVTHLVCRYWSARVGHSPRSKARDEYAKLLAIPSDKARAKTEAQGKETIPLFAIEAVRAWIGDSEIGKGRPYAEGAAVSGCVFAGDLLKACVKGTRTKPYRVWVKPTEEMIGGAGCTCPVGRGSTAGMSRCKHVAAALLAYLEAPNRFVRIEDVYADLESRDKPELLALIQQILQRAPEAEPLLAGPIPGVPSLRDIPLDFYFWQTAEMIRGVNLANDRAPREIAEWIIEMLEDNFAFDQNDQSDVFQAVLGGIARALQRELPENIRQWVLDELPDDLRWTLTSPPKTETTEVSVSPPPSETP